MASTPRISRKSTIALTVFAVLVAAALISAVASASTSASSAGASKPASSTPQVSATASAGSVPTAVPRPTVTAKQTVTPATPAPVTAPAPAGQLVLAHTPKTLDIDIDLTAGECTAVVQDAASGLVLPDPACTPGAIDTAVTQDNLQSTICASGYTTSVRPSSSKTGSFKTTSLAAYGMAYAKTIELDHLVPLELGGASTATNLWPEPNRTGATGFNNPKDAIENALKSAVCNGRVSLAAAQNAMATNWVSAEAALGVG